MIIQIRCSGCDRLLKIARVEPTVGNDIRIEVNPCDNIDCYDCSKCEVEQNNKELRKAIKTLAIKHLGLVAKLPTDEGN